MQIASVSMAHRNVGCNGRLEKKSAGVSAGTEHVVRQHSGYTMLSFTGNNPNMTQIASITPENMGLGLPEAYQGGEGNVGFEMIKSLRDREGKDARNFMPFWEHNNPDGGFKFLIHREKDFPNGFDAAKNSMMPDSAFCSARQGETLEDFAARIKVKPSELSYVIQSKPNGTGPDALSKYCILEAPSVNFDIVRPSEETVGEMKRIPFALLKVSSNNPDYNKIKGEEHYFYYTPDLAKASRPYSYDKWGNSPFEAEIINSDGMRGLARAIHSEMNTEEFGHFKPANVILHDRNAHPYANYVTSMSAAGDTSVNGIKYHLIEHNPGRNYQGVTSDPFKMLAIVADESDIETLKKMPEFEIIKKAQKYGIDNAEMLSERNRQIVHAILDPALRPFQDGAGTYNILKTGLTPAKYNPANISAGTVSYTYGKEMSSPNMADTAKYLTNDFAELELKNVLNGSMPQSMEFDNPDALFGRDKNNGFYKNRAGFTTFTYDGTNMKDVVEAREKNAKWFSGLIEDAAKQGPDALNELFFNKAQIKDGNNVVGSISKVKDGDVLIMTWGRPVEQKGYPITVKGFLKTLKSPDLTAEEKSKLKLVVGGGIWNRNDADYRDMMHDYKQICALDGGRYKNNIMIVDGWFSKRFVGCANYAMFTSRREMCGITPLEAKAAGVPSGVTRTGGMADYTTEKNGFLTTHPVEENPDKLGLSWENTPEQIDRARVERSSDEVVDIYKAMLKEYSTDREGYIARCEKNITEKIDWHENAEYNMGKSANRRYLDDIFEVNQPIESRNNTKMTRAMGAFGKYTETAEEIFGTAAKSRPMRAIFAVVGGIVMLTGAYYLWSRKQKEKTENTKTLVA